MSWRDDSWRDSYDAWKLRSPDEEYDQEDECNHDSFDIDLEGRAHCDDCLASWWPTQNEVDWHRGRHFEYDKWCRQQERREFWRRLMLPLVSPILWIREKVWPRKHDPVILDDDIPF